MFVLGHCLCWILLLLIKFSFDTPLVEIVKDLRFGDQTRTTQLTLMDVLSHRTGLASADLGTFSGFPLNVTVQDMCGRLQFLQEMVPFRTAWYYTNILFMLVSRVCEVTSGQSWQQVVEETIWRPLEMNNTFLATEGMSRDNAALPYILRMSEDDMFVQQDSRLFDTHPMEQAGAIMSSAVDMSNIHPMEPAGAIMSSAEDMSKWLSHLLDALRRPSGRAMSQLRELFTERTLMPAYMRQTAALGTPESILHLGYGMGFITSYYKGQVVYWHSGDIHGYVSYVLLVPDQDMAVYVAVNGPASYAVTRAVLSLPYFVLELMQGHDPWVNLTLACPEGYESASPTADPYDYDYDYAGDDTQETNAHAQVLLRPIEDYLGVFHHGLLGDLVIVQEQERNSLLRMELGRLLVADLIPTKDPFIFTLAPRAPVADTKEWEKPHKIVFKSSQYKPVISPPVEKSTVAEDYKNSTEASAEVDKRVLDMVQMRWKLEVYMFKKREEEEEGMEEAEEEEEEEGGTTEGVASGPEEGEVIEVSVTESTVGGNGGRKTGVSVVVFLVCGISLSFVEAVRSSILC